MFDLQSSDQLIMVGIWEKETLSFAESVIN